MTKFIAVVSGKGGVGKTTATINIGQAINLLGKQSILVDANLYTPHLGINLGLIKPKATLNQFLKKEKSISEVIFHHESGLKIIPASPSYKESKPYKKLVEIFEHLDETADFVLIDSPAGLGDEVNLILKHSDEALIVINPTISSLMDGLKTIKTAKDNNTQIAGVVLNMVYGRNELKKKEAESILDYPIIAEIKFDQKIRKAAHLGVPMKYNSFWPGSAKQFKQIAEHLCLIKSK